VRNASAAEGSLFVVAFGDDNSSGVARLDGPAEKDGTRAFTIPGLPAGHSFFVSASIDGNGDGSIDVHDATVYLENLPPVVVAETATDYEVPTFDVGTTQPVYLGSSRATPFVRADRSAQGETTISSSYQPNVKKGSGTALPLRVVLRSGPQVVTPIDVPFGQTSNFTTTFATTPMIDGGGEADGTYVLDVERSEGDPTSAELIMPTPLPVPFVESPGISGSLEPEFRWRYRLPLPAGTSVAINVADEDASPRDYLWQYAPLEGVTSVRYNIDGRAAHALVPGKRYRWELVLISATTRTVFNGIYTAN
jgi:hypothetical protein